MADTAWAPDRTVFAAAAEHPRHTALVRVTHWITTICFLALLITGGEIVISHPRFYWGETGNIHSSPLFKIPIPASRRLVETGYDYVLPDQNGWSRALHFQAAWALVLTGALYGAFGLLTWHFAKNLLPRRADLSPRALATMIGSHLRSVRQDQRDGSSYNPLQKISYVLVIFVLFPLVIWTGLAMSPAFVSGFPATVTLLGGQQSARTLHLFVSLALLLFLFIHIVMICVAGFKSRVVAMITGRAAAPQEHP